MSSKTGDLDLDIQGQIDLETSKTLVLILKSLTIENFILKLNLDIDHLNVSQDFENWGP